MKRKSWIFWILYISWCIGHLVLFFVVLRNDYGGGYKASDEFWPFSDGRLKYYDWLELLLYIGLPLIIYALTRFVHKNYYSKIEE